MALVLKYAASQEGVFSRSMHSFFDRTISVEPEAVNEPNRSVMSAGTSNSPAERLVLQPVGSLDGAADLAGTGHRPHSRSKVTRNIDSASDFQKATISTSEPFVKDQAQDNLESDPNHSRRKRRKTTPIATGKQEETQTNRHNKKPAQGTLAWFSQPKAIVDNTKVKQIADDGCQTPVENQSNDTVIHPTTETVKATRKSPRKSRKSLEKGNLKVSTATLNGHLDNAHLDQSGLPYPHVNGILSAWQNKTNGSQTTQTTAEPGGQGERTGGLRKMMMKQGKLVQSLPIVLRYGTDAASRQSIGARLNAILSSQNNLDRVDKSYTSSKTHPFFLGKPKTKIVGILSSTDNDSVRESDQEGEEGMKSIEPVPWKDIKFSSTKNTTYRTVDGKPPIWPPLDLQHIGYKKSSGLELDSESNLSSHAKLKTTITQLTDQENVLHNFSRGLQKGLAHAGSFSCPVKHILSGNEVAERLAIIATDVARCEVVEKMRSRVKSGTTSFDRGETAGQSAWTAKYAPVRWHETLQPTVNVLHDWLQNLAVHQIKTGSETNTPQTAIKTIRKKKRQKRLKDELDDFIVDSDDNDEQNDNTISPTALLITGPLGCGKTASVYAVAKELGFEVFEINPGMRRNAKDIFDKVGDMTRNHLVQRSGRSRSSSIALPGTETPKLNTTENTQSNMLDFSKLKKGTRHNAKNNDPVAKGKEQKQSLILLEEVDILFEEDKGFWSGVQSLIQHSKRPVIMTCNEMTNIPVEDLYLHTTLHFTAPDSSIATEYLHSLAAAEGHLIDRQAISTLYASKRNDLRASITELNFWCQMTVGSKYGGLDWMLQSIHGKPQVNNNNERLRIWSQDTYHLGLDIFPEFSAQKEYQIRHVQDSMGFSAIDWYMHMDDSAVYEMKPGCTNKEALDQVMYITEARSALDLLDERSAPVLAAALVKQYPNHETEPSRAKMTSLYFKQFVAQDMQRYDILESLVPIMEEKATFPPSQGRLAPSLDNSSSSVVTDVAPYIRSIVAFDKRLEQHREEISGSQGTKARNTRAARAAAEGGDKAKTRTERWFPKTLDFDKVMRTGNSWPEWFAGEQGVDCNTHHELSPSPVDTEE